MINNEIPNLTTQHINTLEENLSNPLTYLEKMATMGSILRNTSVIKKPAKPAVQKGSLAKAKNWGHKISSAFKKDTMKKMIPTLPVIPMEKAARENNGYREYKGRNEYNNYKGRNEYNNYKGRNEYNDYKGRNEYDNHKEQKENKPNKFLYLGGGALAGILLGMRNKSALDNIRNIKYLRETENLRGIGANLADKYKRFSVQKEKEFDELFSEIADPKHKRIVKNTTKDIDRLIREVSNTLPQAEYANKEGIGAELQHLVHKAHSAGEISDKAKNYLEKSVDSKFSQRKRYDDITRVRPNTIENAYQPSFYSWPPY